MTIPPPPNPPLIVARNARVDRNGCPVCEQLTLQADGKRVVLAGDGSAGIVDAITMQGVLSQGHVLLDGYDVAKREHIGRVGIAPLDPPLPPRMTVNGYLNLSFRTAGLTTKSACIAASSALSDLGLLELTNRRTESLAIPERRAVMLAAAMLPDARSLVAQTPLLDLEGPAAHYLLAVLGQLAKRRNVLATAARCDAASAERDLVMGATHVLIAGRSQVFFSGSSAALIESGPMFAVSVHGEANAFLKELANEGFAAHGDPPRFAVSIPESKTPSDLLAIAQRSGATIVEVVPLVYPLPTTAPRQQLEGTNAQPPGRPLDRVHDQTIEPMATDEAPFRDQTP